MLANSEISALLLEQAIAQCSIGITIVDARHPDLPTVYVNSAFRQQTGDREVMQTAFKAGLFEPIVLRHDREDGSSCWYEVTISAIRNAAEEITHFVGIQKDVSDRIQAEQACQKLKQLNTELIQVLETLPQVIFWKDRHSIYLGCNTAFAKAAGVESRDQIVGKTDYDLAWAIEEAEEYRRNDDRILQTGIAEANLIEKQTQADGRIIWTETSKMPLLDQHNTVCGILGTFKDISVRKQAELELQQRTLDLEKTLTDLRRTQAQLIHSEKMSSLGQLVAGVAHEINNPVNFITGNLTYAQEYVSDLLKLIELYEQESSHSSELIAQAQAEMDFEFLKSDLPRLLTSMKTGADRIRQIVLSLRLFSRLDEAEYKEANLQDAIESTLMLLDHRIQKADIQLHRHYQKLPQVECYASQLNQVFLNVIENAIDALYTTVTPTLTIRTEAIADQRVKVIIADNGTGMTEDVQHHIFDPFFTTKEVGKGTGMGLAISHQIVTEQHHGQLQCESELGKGTTFTIELPIQLKSFS